jgi:hypothetical protein
MVRVVVTDRCLRLMSVPGGVDPTRPECRGLLCPAPFQASPFFDPTLAVSPVQRHSSSECVNCFATPQERN